ncbi:MAG: ABC transporter substrate-binding protein, partial [Sneathiella sp.]
MPRKLFGISVIALGLFGFSANGQAAAQSTANWQDVQEKAKGQTVYWNAWGGSELINSYISWVGKRLWDDAGITLKQVKVTDTADVVSRVLAEKTAEKNKDGSVDLVWINGENFASMKKQDLLFGPFTQTLPNYKLVDTENKATTTVDFTIPVDGLEAPWGMAKFNFIYDSARVQKTPTSVAGLLNWAQQNTGRFTYPSPPDYLGSTFLKQALTELIEDPSALRTPTTNLLELSHATKPLWTFLDALHPNLWRKGSQFPASSSAQQQLLDDGEVDIHLS